MFDRNGNYAQIIVGSESQCVRRQDLLCVRHLFDRRMRRSFSSRASRRCSAAKLTGTSQNRDILLLTADELQVFQSVDRRWSIAEALWKRLA